MAKTGTLKDNETGEVIYPTTLANEVYDSNGNAITSRLPTIDERKFLVNEYEKSLNICDIYNLGKLTNCSVEISSNALKVITTNISATSYARVRIELKKGKTYTIFYNFSGAYNNAVIYGNSSSDYLKNVTVSGTPVSFVAQDNFPEICNLYLYGGREENNKTSTYSNIMIVEGEYTAENMPSYHPYNGAIVHNKDVKPVVLFEGAANNGLTLSDNVENYDYVEIYYDCGSNDGQNSIKVKVSALANGDGDVTLFACSIDDSAFPNTAGFVTHYKRCTLIGKNLTVKSYGRLWGYTGDTNVVKDIQNQTFISRILGYKEV
jgi:hypothetical protein